MKDVPDYVMGLVLVLLVLAILVLLSCGEPQPATYHYHNIDVEPWDSVYLPLFYE